MASQSQPTVGNSHQSSSAPLALLQSYSSPNLAISFPNSISISIASSISISGKRLSQKLCVTRAPALGSCCHLIVVMGVGSALINTGRSYSVSGRHLTTLMIWVATKEVHLWRGSKSSTAHLNGKFRFLDELKKKKMLRSCWRLDSCSRN